MISVFVSYSHKDEELQGQLQIHLTMLKRQQVIDVWHDRCLVPGDEIDPAIAKALEEAQVILLLVSPDFLASDYCYDKEVQQAMERHSAGEARVLPMILRPCDWHDTPFGKLLATPKDGKPVVKWTNIDDAFLDVVRDIRRAVDEIVGPRAAVRDSATPSAAQAVGTEVPHKSARSSNLRIRRSFTEANKDRFLNEAFECMANFFQNSLDELGKRNSDIETSFKRIDARRFTAVIYRNGQAASRCQIFLGGLGGTMDSILYSMNDTPFDSSFNESVSVEEGEQMLGLQPLGMSRPSTERQVLTQEGAAEFYWTILIEPLQR